MRIHYFASMLVLVLVSGVACSPAQPDTATTEIPVSPSPVELAEPAPSQGETVLSSTDNELELVVPEGWVTQTELHNEAQIQAANLEKETYTIVLSEEKTTLPEDLTLERHSELTRGLLVENLADPTVTGPTEVTEINGQPALQYEIVGSIGGIEVAYLHTTVETSDRFTQILAWTLPEQLEANKAELQTVTGSFRVADMTAEP